MNPLESKKSQNENILRLRDVKLRTGLSRSSLYFLIKKEQFPKSISLGMRSVGWVESEINDWIEQRKNERQIKFLTK